MIELFDTSALILAARQPEAGRILADALAADEVALSEPILIEYLNGARNADEYDRIDLALRAARIGRNHSRGLATGAQRPPRTGPQRPRASAECPVA